jgi:multiple sugar transport system substrate-binding protein
VLLPIDSYVTSATKSDMLPSIIDEITESDGKIYGIAQFDSGLSLWANSSILKKAGVRIPTSYKNAWSKSEFEDALKKLKTVCKYPLDISQDEKTGQVLYYTYLPIVKSFGGDWMNKSTKLTSGTLNGKATVSALSYITWLEKEGYINATQDYADGFYNKKESALSLLGHWMAPKFTQGLGSDAILIPIPNFGTGVYTGIGSSCWSMMSAAKTHGIEKECGTILESMMSGKYVKGICNANGAVPSLKSVLDNDVNYKEGGRFYLYREQLEAGIGYSRPKTPATVYMCSEIGKAIANVISGQDAQTALDDASKNIDNNIKQNNYNSK